MRRPAAVIAAAIADDERVRWKGSGAAADDAELLNQLQIISAIGRACRGDAIRPPADGLRQLRAAAGFVLGLAVVKIALGAAGVPAAVALPEASGIGWFVALNLLLFGISGAVLTAMGGRDPRLRSLAAVFVIIAAAFADPLLPRTDATVLDAWASTLRHAPADAFLPAAFWIFVQRFPGPARDRVVRLSTDLFLTASITAGVALFAANVALGAFPATGQAAPFTVLALVDRQAPAMVYWPLLCGLTLPAILFLVWKAQLDTPEARRRVSFFVGAIAIATTPMLLMVIVSPLLPVLAEPQWRRSIGIVLYGALMSAVPSTVYAVAVQRAMYAEFAVHKTMRHRLARHTVSVVSLAPLAYLIVNFYAHRNSTITVLFSGGQSIALLVCSFVGFAMLTFRHHLLFHVDRWFEVDHADHGQTLARLERRFRGARSTHEMLSAVAEELDAVIRPTVTGVLVVGEEPNELTPVAGPVAALKDGGALLDLLRSVQPGVQLNLRDLHLFQLLPDHDRQWLTEAGILELSPLIGSDGRLFGVIALGALRIGLPYTPHQRALIAAATSAASLRLENLWLREQSSDRSVSRRAGVQPIGSWDEPAAYCPACCTVFPRPRERCSCGTDSVAAALPLVVQGKFHVERFIGSGGMGVIYLAVDLTLDRKVAIKTLPAMVPERSARLQQEARAMATIVHPHLAVIFGAEHWRGAPLLIVEYLEGGTLADRLRLGPLSVGEVIDLGVVLADVLDRVHDSGVLHRDIKPSNIGYTRDGVPKLLDFGLAAILDRSNDAEPRAQVLVDLSLAPEVLDATEPGATLTCGRQLVGTPLYLAPEAVAGHRPHVSFDLWSLSLVLYEALAGRHPLGGGSVRQVLAKLAHVDIGDIRTAQPACPPPVARFFTEALARAPERRPCTARELRHQLQMLRASFHAG